MAHEDIPWPDGKRNQSKDEMESKVACCGVCVYFLE